jgi:hypothetical protein
MRAYGASGAHRKAIPHLADRADEASVGHWTQLGTDLPNWPAANRRLREGGRSLTLRYSAGNHTEHRFVEQKMTYGMRL